MTALMLATERGHRECMELLITKGANVNEKDNTGDTALMTASAKGDRECMALLIENGADTTLTDDNEATAMDMATNEETREILRRAPQIRQDFLERQREEAGPARAAEAGNLVAVQHRVRELEARVSELEAELAAARRAPDPCMY